MSRTHLRAFIGAFVALLALTGGLFVSTATNGDADATSIAAGEPTDSTDTSAPTPPVDAEHVLAEAQRIEAFAEAVRAAEAEQAADLEARARAENEASSGIPDSFWDRMAQCETGGNWSMVGSRYSGGLGFYNGTWDSFGGREFAARAGRATREQQIIVANRVANGVGLSGWGCLSHVGRP
jgi:hypothetical protein